MDYLSRAAIQERMKISLCAQIALVGGPPIPSRRLRQVLLHAIALGVCKSEDDDAPRCLNLEQDA
jgi:hypothetical protein